MDALNVGVGDLTVLVGLAFLELLAPLHAVELQIELHDVNWVHHVNKGVTNILLSAHISWLIDIVILTLEVCVDQSDHLTLAKVVDWDVPDHQSGQLQTLSVLGEDDLPQVNLGIEDALRLLLALFGLS